MSDEHVAKHEAGWALTEHQRVATLHVLQLAERTNEALLRVRAAWELYRSGAATLEEITPIMDAAMVKAEEAQAPAPPLEVPVVPAASPGGSNFLPWELSKVGQVFEFDGRRYSVKNCERKGDLLYANLLEVDKAGKMVSDGSPFGNLSIRVQEPGRGTAQAKAAAQKVELKMTKADAAAFTEFKAEQIKGLLEAEAKKMRGV